MDAACRIDEALRRIERLIGDRLPLGHAPGVGLAVTDRERTLGVLTHGVADVGSGTPVTITTRFRLGSLSKSFAGIVALQEAEAGRLDLQAAVTDVVPWLRLQQPYGPIALHHLLTHSSGLPLGSDESPDPLYTAYVLREVEPGFPPGERFLYSNDGWKLAGVVLEEVTGRPIHTLLSERVLEPLGMTRSLTRIEESHRPDIATGYERLHRDRPLSTHHPLVPTMWTPHTGADACVASSLDDMCTYARMLLTRGGRVTRLISEESYATLTGRLIDDGLGGWYGYGMWTFERGERTYLMHPGYLTGFATMLVLDTEAGIGVFIAANGVAEVRGPCDYALDVVRASLTGDRLPDVPRTPSPRRIPRAADYVGRYTGDGDFEIVASSDGLRFRSGTVDAALEVVDPTVRRGHLTDTMLIPGSDLDRFYIEFERDENDDVAGAYHGARAFAREPHSRGDMPLPPEWRAYCGRYRSWNPTTPALCVIARRGRLHVVEPWRGVTELVPSADGWFRLGHDQGQPERLRFDGITPRGAARVVAANGGAWYRSPDGPTTWP